MSTLSDQNKSIVRRFVEEAQTKHNISAVDEFVSPDFVDHSVPDGLPPNREGVKMQFSMFVNALPDLQAIIHDQIADDEKVVTRKTLRGTHRGDLLGIPPTGKMVDIHVIDIVRLKDGKITEHWNSVDRMGLMQQLGVVTA